MREDWKTTPSRAQSCRTTPTPYASESLAENNGLVNSRQSLAVICITLNEAPWGSINCAKRPIGMSIGPAATVAPSSRALATVASQSATAKHESQCGGISAGKKQQVFGDRHCGSPDQSCKRASVPQGRGIHDTGRKNPRFRQAQRLRAYRLYLDKIHVRPRSVSLPIVHGVVCKQRIFAGDGVVKAGQPKIFPSRL